MNAAPQFQPLTPKLVTTFREGYSLGAFQRDVLAGLTVAIVALPLSLALAIASGTTPDRGLITAIIAGFLISMFGGSRVQIGGPTGAFVVVVFNVIAQHGYDGLLLATALAGLILIGAGLLKLGTWIKYIPQPVITGFTAGIALVIFSSQVKDLLGLQMDAVPADFVAKWVAYARALPSLDAGALGVALGSLGVILLLRRFAPRLPGFLIAVASGSLAAWALSLDIATIGSRFGDLPSTLPLPAVPAISWAQVKAVLPSAFTIAFLAGIESLLSAVIADGMTGRRHRSNAELVAQGIANFASTLFGGMPATGAIARTATNIRAGAQSPIAGMMHAAFLLVFMFLLGPLIAVIPLASLAAVLVIVAWNMSEIDHIRHLMRAPMGDRVVLILTFLLTVLVDLTVAIGVGVVLAALMFMHQMAVVSALRHKVALDEQDDPVSDTARKRPGLPAGVELFEMRGPLFFGVAEYLMDVLQRTGTRPRAYVINLREVSLVDATGAKTLRDFIERCARHRIAVFLVGPQPGVAAALAEMHALPHANATTLNSLDAAIEQAGAFAAGS
ncbi:MAG TPA: SulP family inorganic anion transporter [Steroidobacteraceae bacterium]|jgi:SulP family sulfate permease